MNPSMFLKEPTSVFCIINHISICSPKGPWPNEEKGTNERASFLDGLSKRFRKEKMGSITNCLNLLSGNIPSVRIDRIIQTDGRSSPFVYVLVKNGTPPERNEKAFWSSSIGGHYDPLAFFPPPTDPTRGEESTRTLKTFPSRLEPTTYNKIEVFLFRSIWFYFWGNHEPTLSYFLLKKQKKKKRGGSGSTVPTIYLSIPPIHLPMYKNVVQSVIRGILGAQLWVSKN